ADAEQRLAVGADEAGDGRRGDGVFDEDRGAGEALKLMFVITAVAAIALGVFIVAMVPHFDSANLFNIPQTAATGASSFLPFGYVGVWAAIPYAI
ncbi:hypothetical protein, partial [Klebsiella pneumoniae]|uniref:hypothetical protein n=1 Tax=Klebsiella pneumoniae TaxID=573 RepID=UPI00300966F5